MKSNFFSGLVAVLSCGISYGRFQPNPDTHEWTTEPHYNKSLINKLSPVAERKGIQSGRDYVIVFTPLRQSQRTSIPAIWAGMLSRFDCKLASGPSLPTLIHGSD